MQQNFFRIAKNAAALVLYFILALLLIFYLKYITCPVYNFTPGQAFSGNYYYNPYQNMQPGDWHKGNFQIQSYAWGGVTSGRGNTNEEIFRLYESLGYDIIATSDYQKINRFQHESPSYIPVYEHGYGIKKSHQVLIGAKKVLWKDYPLFQTIHNKQHIINKLRNDNELVYLAHPLLRGGYSIENMKRLSNYDGIEVMNNYRFSIDHWDAALSVGNYVSILGNDDAHDISNPDEIGHHCTLINAPEGNQKNIISSLKKGNAFGARIYRPNGESFQDKVKRIKILPELKSFTVKYDTIFLKTDSIASEIRFIGQGGKLLKKSSYTTNAYYKIRETDTYIRTEIHFSDQSFYCLNPVCRYDGTSPGTLPFAEVNLWKTWILRIIGFASLLFMGLNYFILRKKFRDI